MNMETHATRPFGNMGYIFDGVEQAYAVQAGREVRVMVNAETISDAESASVCRDIAKSIEEKLTYPGEIKVTLVREVRIVETAT